MTRFFHIALLAAAVLLWPMLVMADPDTTNEGAYRTGEIQAYGGPAQDFLYVNDHGFWMIGTHESSGHATYHWRGNPAYRSTDRLVYIGRTTLTGGPGEPIHGGWLYQATTWNGQTMYWFFAEAPVGTDTMGDPVYPLFYSTDNVPAPEASFHRYLTNSGTKRM